MGIRGAFLSGKAAETDHSRTSSAEVKDAWRYTSTPPPLFLHGVVLSTVYVFKTWYLVWRRDNFIFTPTDSDNVGICENVCECACVSSHIMSPVIILSDLIHWKCYVIPFFTQLTTFIMCSFAFVSTQRTGFRILLVHGHLTSEIKVREAPHKICKKLISFP